MEMLRANSHRQGKLRKKDEKIRFCEENISCSGLFNGMLEELKGGLHLSPNR